MEIPGLGAGARLGHYRIVGRLGAGGMGEVYRALDEHLHREVAVKVLAAGVLANDGARRRFQREALALSRLQHPHIVTVYDFDAQDGTDFLVMELVAGESLEAWIARGPLSDVDLVRLATHIASALEFAHAQGVVHRDLKPANVVVTPHGDAKILDFGLVKLMATGPDDDTVTALTSMEAAPGTVAYMAPEVLLGHEATPAADLWAFGATLYEMATGRRAFGEPSAGAVVYAITNREPIAPRAVRPGLPVWLETTILTCLTKDPAARPTAAEIRASLTAASAPRASSVGPHAAAAVAASAHGRRAPRSAPDGKKRARNGTRWIAAAAVVVVAAVGTLVFRLWPGRPASIRSLAVLPLDNLSRDQDQEYFADGMTDEIITTLAKLSALRVIAPSSVGSYRGTHKTARQIAHELGVDALVEGSVMRAGDQVRINARLIRAITGQDLWDEHYERTLENVLALQSDVATAIAQQIQLTLTPRERTELASSRQVNPQAYEFYLRGRQAWDEGQFESFKRALGFFQHAIALDSTYAPPYAGVADSYWALSGGVMDPREACPRARLAAERALGLDPTLAEAHTSLGTILAEYYWDWAGAERELRRAIELKPGDAFAHLQYSFYCRYVGDYERDRAELKTAIALDPMSGFTASQSGWPEYFTHRFDDALVAFQETRKSWPNEFFVTAGVAMAYEGKRDWPHAISTFEEACRENQTGQMRAFLAHACGLGGQPVRARAILDTLLRDRSHDFVSAVDLATVYIGLGQRDSAVTWFERGVTEHSDWMQFLKVDPRFDPVREDPRFAAVLRRVGL